MRGEIESERVPANVSQPASAARTIPDKGARDGLAGRRAGSWWGVLLCGDKAALLLLLDHAWLGCFVGSCLAALL